MFVLITVGVLFALDHIWNTWAFRDTWPVILIVIGTVKIFERMASSEGHGGYFNPPVQTSAGTSANLGDKTNAT